MSEREFDVSELLIGRSFALGSQALGATRPDARRCLSELLAHRSQLYPQAGSSSKRHPQISCRPHDPRSRPHPS